MNIINIDYKRACTELLVIINNMSMENIEKIPKDIFENFENNKDDNYEFNLDYSKDLKEQEISDITIAILNNLYRDYWASSDMKRIILLEENKKRLEEERIKKERYNPDNLFKKNNKPINTSIQEISLIKNKESFFTKFKNFVFRILHINN